VLVVQGEDDRYGTIAQVEAIERRVRRCQRLVLPGCGHAPHRDEPRDVLARSLAFLSAVREA
jgi:pimeloyl-ACP methyl ester carboxylesterase